MGRIQQRLNSSRPAASERCTVIIPARGGSKGIPRKNVRVLAGKPLIAHTIAAAKAASCVIGVVVSTDDQEIAEIAQRCGAKVVWRPADISGDTASSESAVLHCLDEIEKQGDQLAPLVVFMQCTSPLTSPEDIEGAVAELIEKQADSCFTAALFHHFLWVAQPDGVVSGVNHSGTARQRRQEIAPQLLENGAVYAMRTSVFRAQGTRFCGKVVAHVVPAGRCLEIDEPADLVQAQALMRDQEAARRANALPAHVEAVVFDFDGVLTDARVLISDDGHEAVHCFRRDGYGLELLQASGVQLLILSKERNQVVSRRADKLGVECLQAIDDKRPVLEQWLGTRSISPQHLVYVGDDANDVDCMSYAACGVCPSDAHPTARAAADLVLAAGGGRGAVRELCDLILGTSVHRTVRPAR